MIKEGGEVPPLLLNSLECDFYQPPEGEDINLGQWYRLRAGHGYLDPNHLFGLEYFEQLDRLGHPPRRPMLHRDEQGEVIRELDIPGHRFTWGFRYVWFKDKYFGHLTQPDVLNRIEPNTKVRGEDWHRIGYLAGYWFDPDSGGVEEVRIPAGPWADNFHVRIFPVRDGYLIIHDSMDEEVAYYVTQTHYVRLLSGDAISNPCVSPDGCKIAFSHAGDASRHFPTRPYEAEGYSFSRIKAIDLCSLDQDLFTPLPGDGHVD